ncbi:MAG: hypothetical protein SGJ10_03930 [Bacteroidota bacterium]|nr:hypothetical protein [Bacteroidota bacterium]
MCILAFSNLPVHAQKKKDHSYKEWFSVGYGYTTKIGKKDISGNTFGPSFNIKPRSASYMHHIGLQYTKSYVGASILSIDYGLGLPYFKSDKFIVWGITALSVLKAELFYSSATYVGVNFKVGAAWMFVKEAGLGLELFSSINSFHNMHGARLLFILK